jgi:Tol biopolymer transport system component
MRRKAVVASLVTVSAFIGASCLGVAGCASNAIRVEEMPDLPIAFVYYDAETARGRAEEIEAEIERGRGPAAAPRGGVEERAVAPVKEITRYIQQTFGVQDGATAKRFQGRLALLDPRTGEVNLVEGARKGAIPQDWSFDHKRLLFVQVVRDEIPHLFELDVTTGDVRRLTHGEMANPEGCYGPDGRIVFTSVDPRAPQRNARIMITDPGGDAPQPLSLSEYAYYPTCAPDGSAVAYTTFAAGGRAQRVVSRSPTLTGKPRILSPGKEPSFSADGRWIVFSAKLKQKWTIWRIRPDGTGRASLGRGGFDEQRPSLSPDNRLFVYVADTKFHQQLYLRRVDGTGDRILLADGDGDRPVW